jgi:hypothetical protein
MLDQGEKQLVFAARQIHRFAVGRTHPAARGIDPPALEVVDCMGRPGRTAGNDPPLGLFAKRAGQA